MDSESDDVKDLEEITERLSLVGKERNSLSSTPVTLSSGATTMANVFQASSQQILRSTMHAPTAKGTAHVQQSAPPTPSVLSCKLKAIFEAREALQALQALPPTSPTKKPSKKFYIVIVGREPGIYKSW